MMTPGTLLEELGSLPHQKFTGAVVHRTGTVGSLDADYQFGGIISE